LATNAIDGAPGVATDDEAQLKTEIGPDTPAGRTPYDVGGELLFWIAL
jgi:hypothetical protein